MTWGIRGCVCCKVGLGAEGGAGGMVTASSGLSSFHCKFWVESCQLWRGSSLPSTSHIMTKVPFLQNLCLLANSAASAVALMCAAEELIQSLASAVEGAGGLESNAGEATGK